MKKQLSFPKVVENEDGYTAPQGAIKVKDLKAILEKFDDDMPVLVSAPARDFQSSCVSFAQWVGIGSVPMSESRGVFIQGLSPKAVQRNKAFVEESTKIAERINAIQELQKKFVDGVGAHLVDAFFKQLRKSKLSIGQLKLLSAAAFPLTEEKRKELISIPARMIRILEICNSVKQAQEKGLYELAEAQEPDVD